MQPITSHNFSPFYSALKAAKKTIIAMSLKSQSPIATSAAPGLLTQVGMAGGAAVITVSFIHPIDVVKVRNSSSSASEHWSWVLSMKTIVDRNRF